MKKRFIFAIALVLALVACVSIASALEVQSNSVVAEADLGSITKIDGHLVDYTNYRVLVRPDCETEGLAEFDCAEVGDTPHLHNVRIAPTGHDWASEGDDPFWGEVIEEPTCQHTGTAQDFCWNCWETRDVFRTIDKVAHTYTKVVTYKAPTCTETGLGNHICVYCGEAMPDELEEDMVVLDKIPHNWSDWSLVDESDCEYYGSARRVCLVCDAQQLLADDGIASHDIYEDGKRLLDVVKGVAKKNPNYDTATAGLDGREFTTQDEYDLTINPVKAQCDIVILENNLVNCYERLVTYGCKYCGYNGPHATFTVTLKQPLTVAHIFNEEPDETWSVAPSCTEPGYNVYLCKKCQQQPTNLDQNDLKTYEAEYKNNAEDWTKVTKILALDHDWSEPKLVRTYEKDGKNYKQMMKSCLRDNCGATYEYLVEAGPDEYKDGLVTEEDGRVRLWNDGVASTESGFTYVEQEDTWYVLDGGYVSNYTGWAMKFDRQWMVVNGKLEDNNNGLVPFKGGVFAVSEGMLWDDWSGIKWLNGEAYLLQNGQWYSNVNRVFFEGANAILIRGGMVDHDATSYTEDGVTYTVINGIIQNYK
jgi:hypothetical protein